MTTSTSLNSKVYRILSALLPWVTVAVLVAIWAITARAVGVSMIIPSVSETLQGLGKLLGQGAFYRALGGTLLRTIAAYLLSMLTASVCAVLAYRYPLAERAFAPLVAFTRILPTMSVILIAVIWFAPTTVPILVAWIVLFPMLYTVLLGALHGVDPQLVEMAQMYRVPLKTKVTMLYLPEMRIPVLVGVQTTLGLAFKLVIAAEVLAQTKDSMGLYMQLGKIYLDMPSLFAWTLVAVMIGGIADAIVGASIARARRKRYAN